MELGARIGVKGSFNGRLHLTILTLMLKPIEYGLIGFVIIAVLWSAQKMQVLPKTFKGFGVEIEIPQEQAEVIRESFLKIDSLEADVAKLREELATLADNAVTFGGVSEVTAQSVAEVAQDVLVAEPLTLKKQITQTGTGRGFNSPVQQACCGLRIVDLGS